MSLFDNLGTGRQQQDPRQMMQQIRRDPVGTLKAAGFTIPAGMRDPQQMVQHLLQTGQVGQGRLQQVLQMMGRR